MKTPLMTAVLVSAAITSAASAQGFADDWEFDGRAQAVIVASTMDDVERLPAQNLLGELSIRATAKKTLENSAQIGFRLEAKAQQDNPARSGFSGNIEPLGPPPLQIALFVPPQPRGAFSGLTRSGEIEDSGFNGVIETAQIYIDGGYGQLSAGLGRGVAARFHEGVPDIFTHATASNPKLDPAGLNIVKTENDLTGPSAKITYQTPRILGVRAGLSYTPAVNASGVDRDIVRSVPGVLTPEIENVIEGSIQLSRKLTEQDLRLRASISYATGEVSIVDFATGLPDPPLGAPIAGLGLAPEDVDVWAGGLELEFEDFSIGAEYLKSNNGFAQSGDYTAWSIGGTRDMLGWEWALRYGESEDEGIAAMGNNWSLGAATKVSQNASVAVGYQAHDVDFQGLILSNPRSESISGPDGVVVEITLSF